MQSNKLRVFYREGRWWSNSSEVEFKSPVQYLQLLRYLEELNEEAWAEQEKNQCAQ